MSEIVADIKAVPNEITKTPLKFVLGGVVFLLFVLILEAFKPGIITGPLKNLLKMVGIGSGA
jgi:hypothetical protein